MPELDIEIFGECQAHLINFENVLSQEFGNEYALLETLAMSLQFSQLRENSSNQAIRKLHKGIASEVKKYIDQFRSALSTDISGDMEYSFKVFLIPNLGNHRSKESLAVEFINYSSLDPDKADEYKRMGALIKERHVPVANLSLLKAGDVSRRVAKAIAPLAFNASTHHARCWAYYKARPAKGASNPKSCNTKFCVYDEAHNDYVYTEEWVSFLISELTDRAKYDAVMAKNNLLC